MRRALQIGLVAAIACAFATPARTARAPRKTFLFVHDNGLPNQVWRYELSAEGQLTPLAGPPAQTLNTDFNASGLFGSAAYSSKKRLLFTAGGFGVSVFKVATDGALTLVEGSPFAPHAEIQGVTVHESGKNTHLYGSDPVSTTEYMYHVHPSGTLFRDPGVEPYTPGGPAGLRAAKGMLLCAIRTGSSEACRIKKDGRLTGLVAYDVVFNGPLSAVFPDATGKTYYVPNPTMASIHGYQITPTKPKPLKGSPYASAVTTASGLASLAVGAGSQVFAFAPPNGGTGDIQAFKRAKNGALTASTTTQNSGMPSLTGGVLDPTGKFLVLVDDISNQLKSFSVNPATGLLTLVDTETADFGDDDVNALVFVQP